MCFKPPHTGLQERGFTLIELLVALALLAVASSLAWQGLSSIGNHRDRVEAQRARSMQIERTIAQLQADIDMLVVSATPTTQPLPPSAQRRGDSLLLLRWPRQMQGQLDSSVELVSYKVKAGQLQRTVLGRAIDPLGVLAAASDPETAERKGLAVLRSAVKLQMQIWQDGQWQPMPAEEPAADTQKNDNPRDPVAKNPVEGKDGAETGTNTVSPGATPARPLPRAIKLQIELTEGRSIERVFLIQGAA
jgi:prepilin-type N-terminal cleavage/methylation domain-containing protein